MRNILRFNLRAKIDQKQSLVSCGTQKTNYIHFQSFLHDAHLPSLPVFGSVPVRNPDQIKKQTEMKRKGTDNM